MFLHVITEELHHRGEIIAILWQQDLQPPDMGWLSVMRKTDPMGYEIIFVVTISMSLSRKSFIVMNLLYRNSYNYNFKIYLHLYLF